MDTRCIVKECPSKSKKKKGRKESLNRSIWFVRTTRYTCERRVYKGKRRQESKGREHQAVCTESDNITTTKKYQQITKTKKPD